MVKVKIEKVYKLCGISASISHMVDTFVPGAERHDQGYQRMLEWKPLSQTDCTQGEKNPLEVNGYTKAKKQLL